VGRKIVRLGHFDSPDAKRFTSPLSYHETMKQQLLSGCFRVKIGIRRIFRMEKDMGSIDKGDGKRVV
jgi:hypothetical protein